MSSEDRDDWEEETTILDEYQAKKATVMAVTGKKPWELKHDVNKMIGDVFKQHADELFVSEISQEFQPHDVQFHGMALSIPQHGCQITMKINVDNPEVISKLTYAMQQMYK